MSLRAFVWGAGKVGRALARGLRRAGLDVSARAARRGLPKRLAADVVILAVRDGDVASYAGRLAASGLLGSERVVVLHCAGALSPEVLSVLRSPRVAVGRFHPLLSFADPSRTPRLEGAVAAVAGDPRAIAAAKRIAKALGMRALELPNLDPVLYHAAAALLANGAATLAAQASLVLERAGVPEGQGPEMLAPLLASVADNVAHLGAVAALTGPVRRGDAATVGAHLARLRSEVPEALALYRALVAAQLPLARALGDAPEERIAQIERLLRRRT